MRTRVSRTSIEVAKMREFTIFILLLNLVLIVDCAKNRRPVSWFFILLFGGPLGAIAYLIYFWESINFPIPLARTLREPGSGKTQKRCPRCGLHKELKQHQDGRQLHFMCESCAQQTFGERDQTHGVLSVLEQAQAIVESSQDEG